MTDDPIADLLTGLPPAAQALIEAAACLRQIDWQHYLSRVVLSLPAERAARAALELIAAVDAPDLAAPYPDRRWR